MTAAERRQRFIVDDDDLDWHDHAACRGETDTFFPVGEKGAQAVDAIARAKAVCASCPVSGPCLEYGLAHAMDHGVWGGTSPDDRRRIRRRRNLRQETPTP